MKKKLGLVTGSFDPITVGHYDIIKRAAEIFDDVIVVVANNEEKNYMFSPEQRLAIVEAAVSELDGVRAMMCDGMVADFAIQHGADAFVRGIRGAVDVEYEQNMAGINYANSGVDTVMLFANAEYHDISSTCVRKALEEGKPVLNLIPKGAAELAESLYKDGKQV